MDVIFVSAALNLIFFLIRDIRNNDTVNAAFLALRKETVCAVAENGVQVHHQQQRHTCLYPQTAYQIEDAYQSCAIFQRTLAGALNDRTFCNRVRERHAQFDQICAVFYHFQHCLFCAVIAAVSGSDKCNQCLFALSLALCQFCINSVLSHRSSLLCILRSAAYPCLLCRKR